VGDTYEIKWNVVLTGDAPLNDLVKVHKGNNADLTVDVVLLRGPGLSDGVPAISDGLNMNFTNFKEMFEKLGFDKQNPKNNKIFINIHPFGFGLPMGLTATSEIKSDFMPKLFECYIHKKFI
jgi:hypothetical protein